MRRQIDKGTTLTKPELFKGEFYNLPLYVMIGRLVDLQILGMKQPVRTVFICHSLDEEVYY